MRRLCCHDSMQRTLFVEWCFVRFEESLNYKYKLNHIALFLSRHSYEILYTEYAISYSSLVPRSLPHKNASKYQIHKCVVGSEGLAWICKLFRTLLCCYKLSLTKTKKAYPSGNWVGCDIPWFRNMRKCTASSRQGQDDPELQNQLCAAVMGGSLESASPYCLLIMEQLVSYSIWLPAFFPRAMPLIFVPLVPCLWWHSTLPTLFPDICLFGINNSWVPGTFFCFYLTTFWRSLEEELEYLAVECVSAVWVKLLAIVEMQANVQMHVVILHLFLIVLLDGVQGWASEIER